MTIIVGATLFFSCKSIARSLYPVDIGAELNEQIADSFDQTRPVKVLYATNRRPGPGGTCTDQQFTVDLDREVRFGACSVSVPSYHSVGAIDETDKDMDADRYFVAASHTPLTNDAFYTELSSNKKRPTLLFVHGFNVRFHEAVMRAAQIAYDAKFQGNVVLFTWPAGAGESMLDSLLINRTYTQNQENAKQTIVPFQTFLEQVIDSSSTLHVVVHSM
ncbi:MAG: alpha/beta hydrolase [Spirochaetia bacterium]|nr:alpha/beta hydrolase [Spirochaetia bacterium]